MLSTINLLLTYKCPLRCDHCYVFGSPKNEGLFTFTQVNGLLGQAKQMSSVRWIVFDGGEPFLYYPLLLKSVQRAHKLGFKVAVFSNGFFARTEAAAIRYLIPMARLKLDEIYLSRDRFHYKTEGDTPALRAGRAARALGIPVTWKRTQSNAEHDVPLSRADEFDKNDTTRLLMVGRAAENLAAKIPRRNPNSFNSCPNKYLLDPVSVSIDANGNVQLCPGLSIGNVWETSLSEVIKQYYPLEHPICGPLISGGPKLLCKSQNYEPEGYIVDGCHLCYTCRRYLVDKYPGQLAPRLVYGISK